MYIQLQVCIYFNGTFDDRKKFSCLKILTLKFILKICNTFFFKPVMQSVKVKVYMKQWANCEQDWNKESRMKQSQVFLRVSSKKTNGVQTGQKLCKSSCWLLVTAVLPASILLSLVNVMAMPGR